jgi:hypothetical protein
MPKQLIMIGGGLSINEGIEKGLWDKLNGKYTIAINYAFRFLDSTLLCFLDEKFQKAHWEEFKSHPLMVSRVGSNIKEAENLYLLPVSDVYMGKDSFTKGVYRPYLSGIFALTMAIQLLDEGDEIFLLGYDWTSKVHTENGKKYIENNFHKDRTLTQTFDYSEHQNDGDKYFRPFTKEHKVKIFNVSPDSNINVFKKISYDEFFAMLDEKIYPQDELRNEIRAKLPEKKQKIVVKKAENINKNTYIEPIIITGVPRSGASLIAGIIDAHGVFGGNTIQGDKHNPLGYFENREIKDNVIKPFLIDKGFDPLGQFPLPSNITCSDNDIQHRKESVLEIMQEQGLRYHQQWYIKDAKCCLDWIVWHKAFPKALWIIVKRNANSTADSLMKTPYMTAYNSKEEWLDWIADYQTRLEYLKIECETIEIVIEDIIKGDLSQLMSLFSRIGIELNPDIVQDYIKDTKHIN